MGRQWRDHSSLKAVVKSHTYVAEVKENALLESPAGAVAETGAEVSPFTAPPAGNQFKIIKNGSVILK